MQIGSFTLSSRFILAPMAGVTDRPFRAICRKMGAGLAVSEMISSQENLWDSKKSQSRLDHEGEDLPISVQILGNDPQMMATTAHNSVINGADIIDINMGCPAKKVCKKAAGSALMQDPRLVADILKAVVKAVSAPVTLKIRTGWDRDEKNALTIARVAEDCGISALTIHGRTRADAFLGEAEYETIAEVKSRVSIPVIANGDIDSLAKAKKVLAYTHADALMIGRSALGNPWIFRALVNNQPYIPTINELKETLWTHVLALHQFYGANKGVRVARKHILWYLEERFQRGSWRTELLAARTEREQFHALDKLFTILALAA